MLSHVSLGQGKQVTLVHDWPLKVAIAPEKPHSTTFTLRVIYPGERTSVVLGKFCIERGFLQYEVPESSKRRIRIDSRFAFKSTSPRILPSKIVVFIENEDNDIGYARDTQAGIHILTRGATVQFLTGNTYDLARLAQACAFDSYICDGFRAYTGTIADIEKLDPISKAIYRKIVALTGQKRADPQMVATRIDYMWEGSTWILPSSEPTLLSKGFQVLHNGPITLVSEDEYESAVHKGLLVRLHITDEVVALDPERAALCAQVYMSA